MTPDDFRRIVESLGVPMAIADARGAIVFANLAFTKFTGQERGTLLNVSLASLFAEGDRKRLQQNIARVGEGKAASAFVDAQLATPGASGPWVQIAFQPALDARDKATGVIAVLQDIGPQRETERSLNLAGARLLALAEASPVAAMIENSEGEIELANEALCRLLEIKSAPQSLTGMPVHEALAASPAIDAKALAKARKKPGEAASFAVRVAGGRTVVLERQPITVDDEPAGAVWATHAEAAEGGAKGAAQIALIEKIGMELSVAMEGISAITIRAQQMEFDAAIVEHFQRIRGSTEIAMAAIGDLVDFSKLSGGVVLHKTEFALRAALADLISRVGPNAEEHDCRLRIKVEQDVSDTLEGDVERLQLVMKNLLDNAFALLPGHEVTLQITPEYVTESGIQLSFSVTAAAEPGHHPAAGVSADAGMGIAVAKFMVAAMGGKLAIATRPTNDALYAFTLEFPVRPSPPAPARATYVSLVGLPVLVVSGDPEQRLQITNLLRGWRLIPLEADNAAMAMALLERLREEASPIPLVILANRLAVQDGFLLAFRIKNDSKFRSTLVMMLASEGRPGDAIACRENGISAYMRYPINDRQLNEAIVAVTGASVDSDETPTLVTRHSLREQRKGATILLVDPSRDSQILAAHILGRHDCSVVVAQDLQEALAALDQDVYDVILVDTSLPGLGGDDAAQILRSRIARGPDKASFVAASLDHSPAYRTAKTTIGFNTTVAKPFRKDELLGLLASLGRVTLEAN
jgi:two-component system sensor histidine kinase/response regulator